MTTWQRACKPVLTTQAFSRRNQHRAKALCWKSGGRKKVLVMLGYHSIQQMLSIQHGKSDFGRNSLLTDHRTSSANHLFTLHTVAHADHRVAIPILHMKYRAQFLLRVGWGGMSYWVYVTLSCYNWKRNDFSYSDFTSASSYGLGWYKYTIATQWYQFHTTNAWWFSLNIAVIYETIVHIVQLLKW